MRDAGGARALRARPRGLIGGGLLLYASGSVVYNLELASGVLLMPIVFDGRTIALLEVYRRAPQAWTDTQVERARVLANHIAAGLARVTSRRIPKPRPAPR